MLDTSRFEQHSNDELLTEIEEAGAELPAEHWQESYVNEILTREIVRLRRTIPKGQRPLDLLFVTVGDQPYSVTLAMAATPARHYVLLVTEEHRDADGYKVSGTGVHANQAAKWLGLQPTELEVLRIGTGKDMVRIYREIRDRWRKLPPGARAGIDQTGGFKTMSAAAAAAAHMLPDVECSYIESDPITGVRTGRAFYRGRKLTVESPIKVFAELKRERLNQLLDAAHYGSAHRLAESIAFETGEKSDEMTGRAANGLALIGRLNCGEAVRELTAVLDYGKARHKARDDWFKQSWLGRNEAGLKRVLDGAAAVARFCSNAPKGHQRPPVRAEHELEAFSSDECLDFLSLLYAQARRRWEQGSHEMAALLAYRMIEACLQRRFAVGLEMASCSVNLAKVAKIAGTDAATLKARLKERTTRSTDQKGMGWKDAQWVDDYFFKNGNVRLHEAGLMRQAIILGEALPGDLAGFGGETDVGTLDARQLNILSLERNEGILAHGFRSQDPDQTKLLMDTAMAAFERVLLLENKQQMRNNLLARHSLGA